MTETDLSLRLDRFEECNGNRAIAYRVCSNEHIVEGEVPELPRKKRSFLSSATRAGICIIFRGG